MYNLQQIYQVIAMLLIMRNCKISKTSVSANSFKFVLWVFLQFYNTLETYLVG